MKLLFLNALKGLKKKKVQMLGIIFMVMLSTAVYTGMNSAIDRLEDRYGIVELDEDLIESYDMIAKKRGALSRGGVADYDKVSNVIIRDLKNGYFGNITFDRLDVKK